MFDKYRIIRPLGDGGSGTVYLAEHIKLKVYRAIKCIRKDNPLYYDTIQEAHILKNLKHLNIPIIYDIEEDQSSSYIIEEYFEGESLKSYRFRHNFIQEDEIINFSLQICKLLEYLHQNERPIIYLDLKPENIMVSNATLKLVDFGTARYTKSGMEKRTSIGTIGYAAPEQYRTGKVDERSDIFSVGKILYFLITGSQPFHLEKIDMVFYLSTLCSKKLAKIVAKCMKQSSKQRYQSITQLYNQLSEVNDSFQESYPLTSQQVLKISFAGAQRRIGTTHTAFLFTSYINRFITSCLYSEENQNPVINYIVKRYGKENHRSGILSLYDCKLECGDSSRSQHTSYPVTVVDYGELTTENLDLFLKADIKVVILGAKDWEIEASESILERLMELDEIIYLFNFVDGESYKEVLDNMKGCSCCRIPYIADPWRGSSVESMSNLVRTILGDRYLMTTRSKIISTMIGKVWKKNL